MLSLHGTNCRVTVHSDWHRQGWSITAFFIIYHTMRVLHSSWLGATGMTNMRGEIQPKKQMYQAIEADERLRIQKAF